MCVFSMIGDDWSKRLPADYPWIYPQPYMPQPLPQPYRPQPVIPEASPFPNPEPYVLPQYIPPAPSQEEFNRLKKEVQELKELLKAAKKYDEATGQKDCEVEEKIALIRLIAKFVGIDFDDLFVEKK